MRYLLIGIGSVSVFFGILGIFLPLLPTTPFLLLASVAFAKSSKRFHVWLLNHKILGNYIRDYTERRGLSTRAKIVTLTILFVSIGLTVAITTGDSMIIRIFLAVVAIAVSVHILSLRTLRK